MPHKPRPSETAAAAPHRIPVARVRDPREVLVVIPACNESGRIDKVIRGLQSLPETFEIAVVDDGSVDTTNQEARDLGATVLRHPLNVGYGAALQTGYIYAQRHGYARLVQMDADGQHDPTSVPALLAELDRGADIVLGSRFVHPGGAPDTTFLRRMGSRMFARIVTVWTGVKITDPTSGFQAMSRRAIAEVACDGFPEDYPDADVLVQLSKCGLKLAEVPVKMHPRLGGVSMHRGTRAAFYAYKMFMSLAMLRIRRRSPYRAAS
jgi:glycosyltransferase involved in cell wall biosynthesis